MKDSYHHGDLRRALLDQASRVLERDGAEAISLRGLARALGVSHAAPGHHFADRAELIAELAADGYRALSMAMNKVMENSPPHRWLPETGRAYVRFALDNPERYRMMFASRLMAGECPQRLVEESTGAYLTLLRASYQGLPDIVPSEYRLETPELFAWSVVHGAVMLWLDGQLGQAVDRDRFLELVDDILDKNLGGAT